MPAIRLRSWRALLILAVAAAAGILATPHARAWYQLRAARSALAGYHPEKAATLLADCLRVWPNDAEVRLLASRAARQAGDLDEADRQLRLCQNLLGAGSKEVALEWALLQAVGGNSREVEEFLQRRAEQDAASRPLIWEALIEGHTRVYRILDALALADHWIQLDPDDVRAHELRGMAYHRGMSAHKGTEDLRRAIELDPTRDAARWHLVLGLLDMGNYGEALKHLHHLERRRPDDPEIRVRVARCHNLLGDAALARQILDAVLGEYPENGLALRTRGQFALADRQPGDAEGWLRRAAEAWPNDYQVQWLLFQSLQQQGKDEAAKAQLVVTEKLKERAERVGELSSRKLSERPLDPALHYEMGVLLLRNGNASAAKGWLLSALNLAPEYGPAHAALADLYHREGDEPRAAGHRLRAGGPVPGK